METLTTKMKESQARLVQQGSSFVQVTGDAGSAFFAKTKKAGETFVTQTRKAGEAFAATSRGATLGFAAGVRAEAGMWLDLAKAQKLVEGAELPKLANGATAKLPSPRELEKSVLLAIEEALKTVEARVQDRLVFLDTIAGPQLPADASPESGSTSNGNGALRPPITNYDELSAKDIVSRLERLNDDKTAAILAYEQSHKKRATILRAAETRLAESA